MASRSLPPTGRPGLDSHPAAVHEAHATLLSGLPVRRRFVEIRGSRRVHVVEMGDGPPAVFLHGTNTSALGFVPLLRHVDGLLLIAVDRPGKGCSDPVPMPRGRFRARAVEFADDVLDALDLGVPPTLVGQSGGGVWSLWYALARTERVRSVVLLGSTPLLPGTRCPAPLRVMVAPVLGDVLARLLKPSPRMLVRLLSSVGEGDTIVRYPDLAAGLATCARDRVATAADLTELRALITPFGFRRSMRFRADELRRLAVPTLLIWGDHDPAGSVDTARAAARLIPGARLAVLPTGHVPQFGEPERVAGLVRGFATDPVSSVRTTKPDQGDT